MKLLNRSLRSFLIYASVLLLIAIPVLYIVVQAIVTEDVNESLFAKKKELNNKLALLKNESSELFFYDPDIRVQASNTAIKDTLYSITSFDSISQEHIPYQVLEGSINVKDKIMHVWLKSSLVDRDDLIFSIVTIVGGLILLIIVGLFLINRSLSRQIWKPFYDALERLRQFKLDGKSSFVFSASNIEEFNNLNITLQRLIDNNQRTYQSQKEFTENASHEMQTPLAILNGNLDLLLGSQPLTGEQAELINNMQQVTGRMNKLNKALVLLARIDNNQFAQTEKINLREAVEKIIYQFEEPATRKKLTIFSSMEENVELTGNRDLVEIMTGNLLSNAIRHNEKEGTIKIDLTASQLKITNKGRRNPLDQSSLFKRFQKQGGVNESPGLGLAIVKRICEISNYRIQYGFQNGLHSFIVDFATTR